MPLGMSIVISIFLGWLTLSLGHYCIHRYWHKKFSSKSQIIAGERLHHDIYDKAETESLDPHDIVKGPPPALAVLVLFLVGSIYMAVIGVVNGWAFMATSILCLVIDDLCHRSVHDHTVNITANTLAPEWFKKAHETHHRMRTKNFSFITGHVWDRVFGTWDQ